MYSEYKVHLFIYDSNVSLGDDDLTSSGFDRFGSGENQLHLKVSVRLGLPDFHALSSRQSFGNGLGTDNLKV